MNDYEQRSYRGDVKFHVLLIKLLINAGLEWPAQWLAADTALSWQYCFRFTQIYTTVL